MTLGRKIIPALVLLAGRIFAQSAAAPSDSAVQLRVQELIRLIETKPSGVFVNEQVKVIKPPDHQPYNPDGSRNQDFTVRPDTEHPAVADKIYVEERREQYLQELIKIGQPAEPALIRAMIFEGYEFRPLYCRALGEIKDLRAAPALLKFYEDGRNQLMVAKAARQLDPAAAAEAEQKGRARTAAAIAALENLSGQKFGDDPAKWQAWWDSRKGQVQPLPVPTLYSVNPSTAP